MMSTRTDGRIFKAGDREVRSAADCYVIIDPPDSMEGQEAEQLFRRFAACGVDAVGIRADAGCEARSRERFRAAEDAGLAVIFKAHSARALYSIKSERPAALETSVTALQDPLMLVEIQSNSQSLVITAEARELEDLPELYAQLGPRQNVCVMWEAGRRDEHINLRRISELRESLPEAVVGFAAPENGELHAIGALALGSWVIRLSADSSDIGGPAGLHDQKLKEVISDLRRVSRAL